MLELYDSWDGQVKALKAYISHPGAIYTVLGFILAFLVIYKLAYMMTGHNQGMSILAAGSAAFGAFSITGAAILGKRSIQNPPAKAYNLDPESTYEQIKEGLSARYFGSMKWHLDTGTIEKLSLLYSIKMLVEDGSGRKQDKGTIQLGVQIERVGDVSGLVLNYTQAAGDASFETKELCEATTQFIDAVLTFAEQRRG